MLNLWALYWELVHEVRAGYPNDTIPHRQPKLPILLVSSLSYVWGFAYSLLIPLSTAVITFLAIGPGKAEWLMVAHYAAYIVGPFLIAAPLKRICGFQLTFNFGLFILAVGSLVMSTATSRHLFPRMVGSQLLIGLAASILERAATAYIVMCGPERFAAARLNFAQGFAGLGMWTSALIGTKVFFLRATETKTPPEDARISAVGDLYRGLAVAVYCFTVVFGLLAWKILPNLNDDPVQHVESQIENPNREQQQQQQQQQQQLPPAGAQQQPQEAAAAAVSATNGHVSPKTSNKYCDIAVVAVVLIVGAQASITALLFSPPALDATKPAPPRNPAVILLLAPLSCFATSVLLPNLPVVLHPRIYIVLLAVLASLSTLFSIIVPFMPSTALVRTDQHVATASLTLTLFLSAPLLPTLVANHLTTCLPTLLRHLVPAFFNSHCTALVLAKLGGGLPLLLSQEIPRIFVRRLHEEAGHDDDRHYRATGETAVRAALLGVAVALVVPLTAFVGVGVCAVWSFLMRRVQRPRQYNRARDGGARVPGGPVGALERARDSLELVDLAAQRRDVMVGAAAGFV